MYDLASMLIDLLTVSSDKSEMTDGCGLINKVALLSLRVKYDWRTSPTAIQCRVGGAKVNLPDHNILLLLVLTSNLGASLFAS